MGKGLQIQNEGVHVAFTAGTGILTFLDLVAHLIKVNIEKLQNNSNVESSNATSLSPNFKFILYVSFPTE